ncbi:hypothetical protein LSTR_LSTR015320 [Laodelphax striatellus]|uniref:mRNA-decapping enzyme C-terminal domain-containing protein n=1 Tax=Laodelphax striatellus TaxID=195883 RepID=A0A482WVQ5_LAOST|nr:hypothetical protein LSTR_LSTR015320 [Laodelphax striatellus]
MEHSESDMNISALRRLDPYFERLIQNAGHVALYTFNTAGNFWEKTDIEGALFVYTRKAKPFHNVFIMNRLNTKNFVEPVVEGLDLHLEDPYLLYKTSDGKIYCLWFYDKRECHKINQVLINILKGPDEMKGKMPEKEGATASGVDLFSMLTKAQEAYNSSSKTDEDKSKESDDTPKSVKDFFMKASQGTHFQNGQQPQMPDFMGAVGPQPSMPPHGLGSMPEPLNVLPNQMPMEPMRNPLKFVEHIEKQQNVAPQHELPAFFNLPQQDQNLNIVEPQPSTASELPVMSVHEIQTRFEIMKLADALNAPIDESDPINYIKPTSRLNKFIPTLPIMEDPAIFDAREPAPQATDTTLMTPMMLSSKKKANKAQVGSKIEPLTKDQLLQAVHYLINNDPDFVQKIHEAYVQSFNNA